MQNTRNYKLYFAMAAANTKHTKKERKKEKTYMLL